MRMAQKTLNIDLKNADETAKFAQLLAQSVSIGDTILLTGDLGAGKTHFARAFIKSLLMDDEDVPSPTFTLVQTYDTSVGEVWHADLYRLSDEQEIEELGLSDAMLDAICLIEWPDRLGTYTPSNALFLQLTTSTDLDARQLTAHWEDQKWTAKLAGCAND